MQAEGVSQIQATLKSLKQEMLTVDRVRILSLNIKLKVSLNTFPARGSLAGALFPHFSVQVVPG